MTEFYDSGADDREETDEGEDLPLFRELGLPDDILARLDELGFVRPTPIQARSIPIVLDGDDLIGKAETGTGKTLAFTAPVISQLDPERVTVQALVLCPTRELAQQCAEVATELGEGVGIKTALLVGGVHQAGQILQLRQGAHYAVGTPGRVLDFLQQGVLRLGYTHHVILDEADRMLDMGFIDEVSSILERTPSERQTLLFSATIPPRIRTLMKRFMREPKTVSTTKAISTVPNIRQSYARVGKHDKERFVLELLDKTPGETCIVFCNTRRAVIELDRALWGRGYPAGSLHGDHDQDRRFKVLDGFKNKLITTLVATDVAARGLDVEAVHRVVNYDVPDEVETYVHRIGRTGRAGGTGESITLVSPLEKRYWTRIVESTKFEVEEIPFRGTKPPPPSFDDDFRGSGRGGSGRGRGGPSRGGSGRGGPSRGGSGRGGPSRGGPSRGGPSRGGPSRGGSGTGGGGRGGSSRGESGRRGSSPGRSDGGRPRSGGGSDRPRRDDAANEFFDASRDSGRSEARRESSRRDSRRDEPRRDEPRRDEPRREESRRDDDRHRRDDRPRSRDRGRGEDRDRGRDDGRNRDRDRGREDQPRDEGGGGRSRRRRRRPRSD